MYLMNPSEISSLAPPAAGSHLPTSGTIASSNALSREIVLSCGLPVSLEIVYV